MKNIMFFAVVFLMVSILSFFILNSGVSDNAMFSTLTAGILCILIELEKIIKNQKKLLGEEEEGKEEVQEQEKS